jgi:hypothetical protein
MVRNKEGKNIVKIKERRDEEYSKDKRKKR